MSFFRSSPGRTDAVPRSGPFRSISVSSAARCVVLGLCLFVFAACNYTPAYAPGGAGYGLAGSILVQEPGSLDDYVFAMRLEERLGRPHSARYLLNYRIETNTEGVGRTPEQKITRFNVSGTAQYEVIDAATGNVVHSGTVEGRTGYSAKLPLASARAAARDASKRLMVILADQVAVRALAGYRDWEG